MSKSDDATKEEVVSFTIRVSKQKDDALEAIQHLLNAPNKTKLVLRYIDEGMQRDLDPERTAKLFQERQTELDRLRNAIKQ